MGGSLWRMLSRLRRRVGKQVPCSQHDLLILSRWQHANGALRIATISHPLRFRGLLANDRRCGFNSDSQTTQAITNGGASLRVVLTDATGEDQGVDATERDNHCCDLLADRVAEHGNCQQRVFVG